MKKHKFVDGTKVKCIATLKELKEINLSSDDIPSILTVRQAGNWFGNPSKYEGKPVYKFYLPKRYFARYIPESLLKPVKNEKKQTADYL